VNTPFAALACALTLVFAPSPQDPSPARQAAAERFAAALKATGRTFETTSSGKSYVLPFDHAGAIRRVFVAVNPDEVAGLHVHVVYTDVWSGAEPPDGARMRTAFTLGKPVGTAYLLQDSKGTWAVRFGVRFDATDLGGRPGAEDPLVKRLADVVALVDTVGEELQKALK